MTRSLQSTWLVGKVRFHHAGFGVYSVRGRNNSPAERFSGPYESANKAVHVAERLGEGHAAFRIVRSSADGHLEATELLSRDDLPVNLV
jgi:hypothetical protein